MSDKNDNIDSSFPFGRWIWYAPLLIGILIIILGGTAMRAITASILSAVTLGVFSFIYHHYYRNHSYRWGAVEQGSVICFHLQRKPYKWNLDCPIDVRIADVRFIEPWYKRILLPSWQRNTAPPDIICPHEVLVKSDTSDQVFELGPAENEIYPNRFSLKKDDIEFSSPPLTLFVEVLATKAFAPRGWKGRFSFETIPANGKGRHRVRVPAYIDKKHPERVVFVINKPK